MATIARPDDRVFASLPLAVIAYGTTLGLDREELIAVSGLAPADLTDPDRLVEYESLLRLWARLLERFGDRPLGLDYAGFLSPGVLGVVGYACANCRDLRGALQMYARYCRLADPRIRVQMEEDNGTIRMAVEHEPRVEAMAEPMEMFVASVALISRRLNPSAPPPDLVCFAHPRRHPIARYEQVLRAPVRFDAGWTGATFAADALRLPILGADPRIGRYLAQRVEAMSREQKLDSANDPFDTRVRRAIEDGLLEGLTDQATIARQLGASARSLQRRLSELGTSFSELLDDVRRTRALALLDQPGTSIREIAVMLGYADPRAFYRSFRRWTGHTPAEYRRQAHE